MNYDLALPKEEGKSYNVITGQETNDQNIDNGSKYYEFLFDPKEFKNLMYKDYSHPTFADTHVARYFYRIVADFDLAFQKMNDEEKNVFIAAILNKVCKENSGY